MLHRAGPKSLISLRQAIDMEFSIEQLGANIPRLMPPGKEYSAVVSFKDAPVVLPIIGTTPSCVNLHTKQMIAKVTSFKWAYFDLVDVWGAEIFMHVVQKHTHETLLLWRVVHAP